MLRGCFVSDVVYSFLYDHRNAVFFFKQKTAYEMRISDWSSDVCSSDLREQQARASPALASTVNLVLPPARTGTQRSSMVRWIARPSPWTASWPPHHPTSFRPEP